MNSLKIKQGDIVYKKIDGSVLFILKEMEPSEDEIELGAKFLVRTLDHKKLVIHAIEITGTIPVPSVTY